MSSATIIPLRIGKTDATGRLNCKVTRLQRRVLNLTSFSGTPAATVTLTVGFPISHAECSLGNNDSGSSLQTFISTGYYDVLGASQNSTNAPGTFLSYSDGNYYTASIVSNDILLTKTGGASWNNSTVATFIIYEAL